MSLPNLCHACGQWRQNCTCPREEERPTRAFLVAQLAEFQEHEEQTHRQLGAILGTDDSLERLAKQLRENYDDLREFVRLITLQLQTHEGKTPAQWTELFHYAYRLYVKHDVEKQGPIALASPAPQPEATYPPHTVRDVEEER